MGNDMYNEEQLAHAKTMSEILKRSEIDDLLNRIINSTEDWKSDVDTLLAHDYALRLSLARETEARKAAEEKLTAAYQVIDSDNAVCLCGCPLSEHEAVDEGAEQCEHEDHVCLRTCPAIRDLYVSQRLVRVNAEREAAREHGACLIVMRERESLRDAIEIEREGQRSMARALAEIRRLSDLNVAINLAAPPADAATEAVRDKNIAYHERNMVVAALSKLFPAWLMPHRDEPGQEWDAKWRTVVAIQLPTGQVTWHVDDAEVGLFGHLDWRVDMTWDGHDTEEKYRRLAALFPAPAPSAKEAVPIRISVEATRGGTVTYSGPLPAAPSTHALRRCEVKS